MMRTRFFGTEYRENHTCPKTISPQRRGGRREESIFSFPLIEDSRYAEEAGKLKSSTLSGLMLCNVTQAILQDSVFFSKIASTFPLLSSQQQRKKLGTSVSSLRV